NEIVGWLADPLMNKPQSVAQDRSGEFWVADYEKGLVRTMNQSYSNLSASGPADISTFKILADAQSVIVLAGGYGGPLQFNSKLGFYEFRNGSWQTFNYNRFQNASQFPDIEDLSDVVRNPANGKLYFASYGYGLLEWTAPGDFKVLGQNVFTSSEPAGSPDFEKFQRLSGVAADEEGNVWAVNPSIYSGTPSLHQLRPDGSWQ